MHQKSLNEVLDILKARGLRPTRQRRLLVKTLFGKGDRHVTADSLFQELRMAGTGISRATVYNTLNLFKECGLLREVIIASGHAHFDTNLLPHYHFFHEKSGHLEDIPCESLKISPIPSAPEGARIRQVDIVVRLEA